MAEISLKIKIGETELDLQGDNTVVEKIFNDIKLNGLGKLNEIKNEKPSQTSKNEIIEEDKEVSPVAPKKKTITKQQPEQRKSDKKKTTVTSKKPNIVDLGMSKDDIRELEKFYKDINPTKVKDQILILAYWYNKFKKSQNFDEPFNRDILYTLYRNVGIIPTANLDMAFANLLSRSTNIERNAENKSYFVITTHGEAYVEDFIKKGDSK